MATHHPDRKRWPDWTLDVGNQLFHKAITIAQTMRCTEENFAILRAFIDALEYEYLQKRRELDSGG